MKRVHCLRNLGIAFFVALLLLLPLTSALAAERNGDLDIITSIHITDSAGNALGDNTAKDASIILEYTFAIPNEATGSAGDTFTISVPDEIAIFTDLTATIQINGSVLIATAYLSASSRTITLVFTDEAFSYSDVSGNFWFELGFNSDEIGSSNPVNISFDTGAVSSDITIPVNFDQSDPASASITKSGVYNATTNEITWTITANSENATVASMSISDTLTSDQTLIDGSVTINGSAASSSDYAYDSSSGTFTYTFPGQITSQQVITFKTAVSDAALLSATESSLTVSNDANLTADGVTTTSNTASVTIPISLITKSDEYLAYNGSVTYTIVVNANNLSIDNATVTDTLPDGLDIDTTTIYLDGVAMSVGTGAGMYSISGQDITFYLGDITSSHTITYTCTINENAFFTQTNEAFVNTAGLNGDSVTNNNTASTTFTPSTPIIAKSALGYDESTGYITWQVYVNGHGGMALDVLLYDLVITETITDANQDYVLDSLVVKDTAGTVYTSGTLTSQSVDGFVYSFPSPVSGTYILTFYTRLVDPEQYKSNYSGIFYNSIDVSLSNGTGGSSSYAQSVTSEVLSKTANDFDYDTHEMSYTITVNADKVALTGVVVTDTVSSGQTFLPASFTVTDSSGTEYTAGTLTSDDDSFSYSFPGTINDTYTITYRTLVSDATLFETNGTYTLSNNATLIHDEITTPIQVSDSKTITSQVVTKSADYTSGNDYIDWTITVNREQQSYTDAVITDNLEEGLALDTSSIQLYSVIVNADGSVTKNADVTISGSNVTYNYLTRVLTVYLPSPMSEAYQLKFRTYVTDKYQSPFGNEVIFDADSITAVGYVISEQVNVSYTGSGGSATGSVGSMTVYKVDQNDNTVLLQGAVFNLVDQYGIVIDQQTTDANGEAFFDLIQLDTQYTIYEITAPTGYVIGSLGTSGYTFTISSSDATGYTKTITFENASESASATGSITLTKVTDTGAALSGAVFSLYATSDTSHLNVLATATSDASGIVLFENLVMGSYDIVETTAPTGYTLSSVVATATLTTDGETVTASPASISNAPIPAASGSITLTKVTDTGAALSGAVFSLYATSDTSHSTVLATATSDALGIVLFENLAMGSYDIVETTAPTGYTLSSVVATATLTTDGETVTASPASISNSPYTGSITLTKVTDTGAALSGAVFSLYATSDTSHSTVLATATSDASGIVLFENLAIGSYDIVETTAPAGYTLSTVVATATLTTDGETVTASPATISNSPYTGSITLTKVTDTGAALSGAVFSLYATSDTSHSNVLATATSDASGIVLFENLAMGSYDIMETTAPAGYTLSTTVATATLTTDGETVTASPATISNSLIPAASGSITLTKVTDTGAALSGAVFSLYATSDTSHSTVLATATSNASGIVLFENLAMGSYDIVETTAPAGYTLSTVVATATLTTDGETVTASPATISNSPYTGSITLTKVTDTGAALSGAVFSLYATSDTSHSTVLATATSDASGIVLFENLAMGSYDIVETTAPAGYTLSTVVATATLTTDGETVTASPATISNSLIPAASGSITLTKVTDTGAALSGAVFSLYATSDTSHSTVLATATSDASGIVLFENLAMGSYDIVETSAPTGYTLSSVVATATLTTDGETVTASPATISNSPYTGSITLTKVTDTGAALSGAVFSLYATSDTSHSTVLATATSDASGIVLFENLAMGSYDIIETSAPTGYTLSSVVATATLTTDDVTVVASPNVITDILYTGNLLIQKTVAGDLASETRAFTFTVTLSTNGTYSYSGSYSGTISSGDTIQLTHGQYILITGLPAGTTYSVTESNYGSYARTSTGSSGTIAANSTSTASFINTLSSVPQTGDDNTALKGWVLILLGSISFGLFFLFGFHKKHTRTRSK